MYGKCCGPAREAGLAYQQEDYGSGFKPLDTPEFQRLNPNSPRCRCYWTMTSCSGSRTVSAAIWRAKRSAGICCPPNRSPPPRWSTGWTGRRPSLTLPRRHAFMGLVRKDPRFQDPVAIKESIAALDPTACALLKRSCSVPGRG